MNALPLIPAALFLVILAALQAVDGWSTYQSYKLGKASPAVEFKEMNPVMRVLFKAFGVKNMLWVAKLAALAYAWYDPLTLPRDQWILLALYVAVGVSNLVQLRRAKKRA